MRLYNISINSLIAWWRRTVSNRAVYNDEPDLFWLKHELKRGKTTRLLFFLESGGNPNLATFNTGPPLDLAITYHCTSATKLLLDNGAKTQCESQWNFVALCSAAFNGYPDIVKLLLNHGVEVDSVWMQSTTALHEACMMRCGHPCPAWDIDDEVGSPGELNRYLETARMLIAAGADVNAVSKDWPGPTEGYTPLHFAVAANCLPMIKLLLENDADLNITEDVGRTPLDLARDYSHTKIAEYLEAL